jgi:hypothetical protein
MGAFMGGIAVAPFVATLVGPIQIAVFSGVVRTSALAIAVWFLPETLSVATASSGGCCVAIEDNKNDDGEANAGVMEGSTEGIEEDTIPLGRRRGPQMCRNVVRLLLRPFHEMRILGRNRITISVAFGAFMSKMVFSGDSTLFFYYVENHLGASMSDVAIMMLVTGVLGVLVQAGLLQYLISMLGERQLLIASFASGSIHNLIYGLAPNKWIIYAALCFASITNTNGPLLSALASRNVADTEQGRAQGALFGLTSLAEAAGPLCFNLVNRKFSTVSAGPGSMFLFGAGLYFLGFVAVSMIPPKPAVAVTHSVAVASPVSAGDDMDTEAVSTDDDNRQEISMLLQ